MNFKYNKISNRLLQFSIFFPFVGIIPGIDIQPNFLLFSLSTYAFSVLLLFRTKLVLSSFYIFLFCIFLYTLRILFDSGDFELKFLVTYWVGLLTPFMMWNCIFQKRLDTSKKFIYLIILCYFIAAFLQIFIGKEFLGFLVTRPSEQFTTFTSSYRGYRSLCPEPSNFGKVIIYLNILVILTTIYPQCTSKRLKISYIYTFVLFSMNIVLSQSFYSVCFHAMILMIILYYIKKKHLITFFFYIITIFLLFYILLPNSRFSIILKSVLFIDYKYIISQGAFARVSNVFQSLYGGLYTLPFGFGGSNHKVLFISDIYSFAIGKRNLGGLVEHFLRFGIVSSPFFIFIFLGFKRISLLESLRKFDKINIGFPLGFSVILLMLQDGSVADPLPWFIFFLLLKKSSFTINRVNVC